MKTIGALEVLGAIGLVLPALLDTATALVPVAVAGLALMMCGAVVVHARRAEYTDIASRTRETSDRRQHEAAVGETPVKAGFAHSDVKQQ